MKICIYGAGAIEGHHGVQWARSKGIDGYGPFGPVIVTGVDAAGLVVRTIRNGEERRNYPIADT